jgi:hypothetical protein
MVVNKIRFFALIAFTFFGGVKMHAGKNDHESPLYVQYVHEVTSTFLNEVYKKYGFACDGSGGSMPYDVQKISVSLVTRRSATIEQAREWEILLTERFAQIINEHEKIKPFLRASPFPPSRVNLSIDFITPKKERSAPQPNHVTFVFQARNKIFYKAKTPDDPYMHKDLLEEPYEEALKIVQANASKKVTLKQE